MQTLSRARENTFNIRTASLKATLNGRRTDEMRQYFNEEKKKRERKNPVKMQTLSRTHHHLHNSFILLLQKPLFRPEEKSLSSISLSVLRAKTERKRYRKGVSFPFSSAEKIKKNRGEHPKKRKTKFFQHRLHGPKFSLSMMMRANKNAPPPFNKQRERRVDFKLAQKQPNVFYCYSASGRARVWTRCGSDRARFPDARERANFSLRNFFSFSFCFWARKSFFRSQNSG